MNPKRSRPIPSWVVRYFVGYAFILPFLAVAVVFLVFPIGYSFYLSFRETWAYLHEFDQFADMGCEAPQLPRSSANSCVLVGFARYFHLRFCF